MNPLKSNIQSPFDNLGEQLMNISKANAYDVVSKQVQELQAENEKLKNVLNNVKDFLHIMPMLRLANKQGFDECVNIDKVTELKGLCDAALNGIEIIKS